MLATMLRGSVAPRLPAAAASRASKQPLFMPACRQLPLPSSLSPSPPSLVLFSTMRVKHALPTLASSTFGGNSSSVFRSARHHQALYRRQSYHVARQQRAKKPVSSETVVLGLITANVAVTMLWLTAHSPRKRQRMMAHFTTSSLHLARGQYHTLLTSVFSHADVGHLLANMVGLFFFGRQMCDVLGARRFLALYVGSGVFSSAAAVLEQQYANRVSFNLGASGAVNSITAMSILLFPRSTLLIFGIVPLPAWVAGSMFIFKDAYSWATDRRDGIGHFAHLGGAFCGGAYYFYLRRTGAFRYFRYSPPPPPPKVEEPKTSVMAFDSHMIGLRDRADSLSMSEASDWSDD